MSTMVVQERHLWLNLAEMKDCDKAHFLDAPISQAGLFDDTVKGFAQQFSAVKQQTEANQHICPGVMHHPSLPPGPGLSLPVAMGALLRPPSVSVPPLVQGPAVPTFSRKSNFLFLRVLRSMGRQCATPCFLTLAHDPFCQ